MVKICDAIGLDSGSVNRLVIDAEAGEILAIYVTFYPGKSILNVEPPSVDFAQVATNGGDAVFNKAIATATKLVDRYRRIAEIELGDSRANEYFTELRDKIFSQTRER